MKSILIKICDIEVSLASDTDTTEELAGRALGLVMHLIPERQKLTSEFDEGDGSGDMPQVQPLDVRRADTLHERIYG